MNNLEERSVTYYHVRVRGTGTRMSGMEGLMEDLQKAVDNLKRQPITLSLQGRIRRVVKDTIQRNVPRNPPNFAVIPKHGGPSVKVSDGRLIRRSRSSVALSVS